MLWTPVPTWTPSPAEIEAGVQAQVARENGVRALLIACVIVALSAALSLAIIALSASARHIRATVQLEPTRAHRRVVVQLPDGRWYDARGGSVDVIADSQQADIASIEANAQADVEPLRVLTTRMKQEGDRRIGLGDGT